MHKWLPVLRYFEFLWPWPYGAIELLFFDEMLIFGLSCIISICSGITRTWHSAQWRAYKRGRGGIGLLSFQSQLQFVFEMLHCLQMEDSPTLDLWARYPLKLSGSIECEVYLDNSTYDQHHRVFLQMGTTNLAAMIYVLTLRYNTPEYVTLQNWL